MPDFAWVQSAIFSPTCCATCMTHRDPGGFVDLLVDTPAAGRLYMCATCVERAGREVHMLSRGQADDLTGRLARQQQQIAALQDELEREKENKLVSLADVRTLVGVRGPGRPRKDALEPGPA